MSGVSIALLRRLNTGKHLRWVKIDLQRTADEQEGRCKISIYQTHTDNDVSSHTYYIGSTPW